MNSNLILTVVLGGAIVIFIFVRQIIQLPVTQRSLLLPLMLSVALGGMFLLGHPTPEGIATLTIGAVLGVGTGLLSGQVIRVWRDEATGIIFQRGGWRYLIVLIALLLARVLIRFLLYIKLRTSPLDTGLEQEYTCSIRLLNAPGKVSVLHTARPIEKARTSLAPFLS